MCCKGHEHCLICRLHLVKVVRTLAKVANDAFVNGGEQLVHKTISDDLTTEMPTIQNSCKKMTMPLLAFYSIHHELEAHYTVRIYNKSKKKFSFKN